MRPVTRLAVVLSALLLPAVSGVSAQQVTGRITDSETAAPLAAVQVFIAGSGIGALSQQNGRYLLLNVPAGTHTVTAERIGYRSVSVQLTVTAGETRVQDFALTQEALGLDEIVVTGTPGGTQRRAIGNTIEQVMASQITQAAAVTDLQQMLTARSTGLQYTSSPGSIGSGSSVRIRGVSSFNMGYNPLIYVDGVRVNNKISGPAIADYNATTNPLDDFNPEDIESIEIIKGPAAATLYGTEAAAGVIQIITKKGAEGAPSFNLSVRQGVNFLKDPAGKLGLRWGCTAQQGPPCTAQDRGLFSYNMYDEANALIQEGAFEWPTENLYQYGPSQNYDLSVQGGSQVLRYFLSANYQDDEGYVWYNRDKALRLRANVGVTFSENFSLDVTTGYVDGNTRYANPIQGDGGEWTDLAWSYGYCLPRVNPGKCPRLLGFHEFLPVDVAAVEAIREYTRYTGSATLNFTAGWLSSRVTMGVDKGTDRNDHWYPLMTVRSAPDIPFTSGDITVARPISTLMTADWSASANLQITESIGTQTSVGAQYYFSQYTNFQNRATGFPSSESRTVNQASPGSTIVTYTHDENKSLGFYLQEQLSWNDRVFLTGALRFDDHSAFGAEFESNIYPKASATWVMSEEGFWNIDVVNQLRLRAALGQAGRQPSTLAGVNTYAVAPGPGGNPILHPANVGNTDVGPEVSTELELGFDVALLDDRIGGEFTYFRKKTEDALLNVPIGRSGGFYAREETLRTPVIGGSVQRNLGRIDTWGWEARLSARIYDSPAFSFSMDVSADHTDNEVKSVGDFSGSRNIRIGQPYPAVTTGRLVVSAKLDPAGTIVNPWGERFSAMCDPGVQPEGQGDQYAYVPGGTPQPCQNVAATGILLGTPVHPYTFSVSPTVSLLNDALQLHALLQGMHGAWKKDDSLCCYDNSELARTQKDPMFVTQTRLADDRARILYKGSFWKVRELGLLYNLPEFLAARIGADRASISLSGRNLWTPWREQSETHLHLSDPEFGATEDDVPGGAQPDRANGRSNWFQSPPMQHVSATLRVVF